MGQFLTEAEAKALFVEVLAEKITSDSSILSALKNQFGSFLTGALSSEISNIISEEKSKWHWPPPPVIP